MISLWLYGLPGVEEARATLDALLGAPAVVDRWTLGEAENTSAWLSLHAEPEPWQDNSGVEAGPVLEALLRKSAMPQSTLDALAFLKQVQGVLGGVIRDDADELV